MLRSVVLRSFLLYILHMSTDVEPGRRIYIHRDAFAAVAAQGKRQAYEVSSALTNVRLAKIGHHYVQDAADIGAPLRPEIASVLEDIMCMSHRHRLAGFLGRLTFAPKIPWKEGREAVLRAGEDIDNTCYQDGFYTFATGPEASDRMFEDRSPIPDLKHSIVTGEGPVDLTIITSKSRVRLEELEPDRYYGSPVSASNIDEAMRRDHVSGIRAASRMLSQEVVFSDLESKIVGDMVGSASYTLLRTSNY